MKRASRLVSEEDRKIVSVAIAEAEKTTSGEIVPVVATASGRYDRAEDIFGVLTALVALAGAWILFQGVSVAGGDWSGDPQITLGLLPCAIIVVIGFIVGSALATYLPVLRLPFITRKEKLEEVERRAHEIFARQRVRGTSGGTGVLIYVSLYEHMVRVLPDDAIAEKIDQPEWNAVCDLVIAGIKEKRLPDGIRQAVLRCGELLTEHFPVEPGDVNELTNELTVID